MKIKSPITHPTGPTLTGPQHQTTTTNQSSTQCPLFITTPPISFSLQNPYSKMKALLINNIFPPTLNFPFYPSTHTQFTPLTNPSHFLPQRLNLYCPFTIKPVIKPLKSVLSSTSMASSTSSNAKPFSVLFVCLGNICRSPAAEGVFRDLVKKRGLDSNFNIDSAGTINYHEGNPADARMRTSAKRRGVEITSISRPIRPSDFRDFDLILAMDKSNRADILGALEKWKQRENLPPDADKKVKLMCSYCKKHKETEVPDPYYGGQQGFEKVLDLLEDACESLLDSILMGSSRT